VLKLKTANFANRTRAQRLPAATCLPDRLFAAARTLLGREIDGTAFRLIGIGASPLAALADADKPDLANPEGLRQVATQKAIDSLREKFGAGAISRGRSLPPSA